VQNEFQQNYQNVTSTVQQNLSSSGEMQRKRFNEPVDINFVQQFPPKKENFDFQIETSLKLHDSADMGREKQLLIMADY
jgi:hypothetical protein